jgi:hypothetical protein
VLLLQRSLALPFPPFGLTRGHLSLLGTFQNDLALGNGSSRDSKIVVSLKEAASTQGTREPEVAGDLSRLRLQARVAAEESNAHRHRRTCWDRQTPPHHQADWQAIVEALERLRIVDGDGVPHVDEGGAWLLVQALKPRWIHTSPRWANRMVYP